MIPKARGVLHRIFPGVRSVSENYFGTLLRRILCIKDPETPFSALLKESPDAFQLAEDLLINSIVACC